MYFVKVLMAAMFCVGAAKAFTSGDLIPRSITEALETSIVELIGPIILRVDGITESLKGPIDIKAIPQKVSHAANLIEITNAASPQISDFVTFVIDVVPEITKSFAALEDRVATYMLEITELFGNIVTQLEEALHSLKGAVDAVALLANE